MLCSIVFKASFVASPPLAYQYQAAKRGFPDSSPASAIENIGFQLGQNAVQLTKHACSIAVYIQASKSGLCVRYINLREVDGDTGAALVDKLGERPRYFSANVALSFNYATGYMRGDDDIVEATQVVALKPFNDRLTWVYVDSSTSELTTLQRRCHRLLVDDRATT